MCYCRSGCNKQQCAACTNKYKPYHVLGALLGVLWDSCSEAKAQLCLGGLVSGAVFTFSVISAVRWMCSSDKRFPWWGPYLTTNHSSSETDVDLKLPPFSHSPVFWSRLGPLWLHCLCAGYLLLIAVWGLLANPQLLNQVSLSAFVNEMLVWVEAGSKSLQHNSK